MGQAVKTLRFILGDQLNRSISSLDDIDIAGLHGPAEEQRGQVEAARCRIKDRKVFDLVAIDV